MFKKFTVKEDVASNTIIKSSTQRAIRTKLCQQFPALNQPIQIIPEQEEEDEDSEDDNDDKPVKNQAEDPSAVNNDQLITLLESLWPKKESLNLLKCREHVSILVCKKTPLFFQHFDGPYFPTLKLLHQYPTLLPQVQVDKGAIKFVLSGANIMCPGLTSAGAKLPEDLPSQTPVAVHAEGKSSACAIGFTQKSSKDMIAINKGIGVDNVHWLGDDLWLIDEI
ncbi:hypothetical protein Pst134EA_030486 [Puccinia striiformis f. sp. tritici]|uniref:Translation machinery-associated protein 20 n=1 Tax=Puccinia striiformis TaxID=27350 RepID=A0A2S4V2C6_9BASI|nr:hypothetical protein Pst134EA_030486 [Puccinia striiformis f. sp. tritici]KAH9446575.1 hypothetical protein Pst134EA_030486 [Puccinia striiformis f. sp. tritici]KAI9600541.1 hypothetical protein H4Q26_000326 [Puccinia striiformis f. sp. tritici PST-130]POW03673.1 hypothetical protein PSHT_11586 [Puccinia striiformis]